MKTTQALFLLLLLLSTIYGMEVEEHSKTDWKKKIYQFSEQYFKVVPFLGVFSKTIFNAVKISDGRMKNSHLKTPSIHEYHFIRI